MSQNETELRHGPLGDHAFHLCVDMQRLFGPGSAWHAPWLERVLPTVVRLARARPERTIFTRFIPPESADEMPGTWRRYYERWSQMTLPHLPPGFTDLLPPLAALVPPARAIDKRTYSPWLPDSGLHELLRREQADTLIITGVETDVCVLAAVLGAVDLGYRVIVPTDAICSSSDETHDALLALYRRRYGQQIETIGAEPLLSLWRP